jgi:hypothetical protein
LGDNNTNVKGPYVKTDKTGGNYIEYTKDFDFNYDGGASVAAYQSDVKIERSRLYAHLKEIKTMYQNQMNIMLKN